MKIKDVEHRVKNILVDFPETRDSDEVLYYFIIREDPVLKHVGDIYDILIKRKEFGLPSLESVGRTRRKLQEKFEDLRGTKWATRYRKLKEEEYRAYALDDSDME